jgi:hypothetical protein
MKATLKQSTIFHGYNAKGSTGLNKAILLQIILLAGSYPLWGQSANPDHDALEARKQGVHSHHADSYVANVLTGRAFSDYRNQFKQFFLGKYTARGTLEFDGVRFEDVELQYNLYEQNMVVLLETEHIERYITVTLDKVSEFSVYGHDFTQVQGDSVMENGIYELAYAGVNSSVFIERTKLESTEIENQKVRYEYQPVNKYYIQNDFGTFIISRKKDLLKAYHNDVQLVSILKKHKVRFSKRKIEQGLITAISQLETGAGPTDL